MEENIKTKKCSQCGRELPINNFAIKNKAKGTYRSSCKECFNNFMKKKYHDKKEVLQKLKTTRKCAKCGYSKYSAALDFHHKDPKIKDTGIARITSNKYSIDNALKEIDKCIVLCSNCHRQFHFLNNQNSEFTIEEFLTDQY